MFEMRIARPYAKAIFEVAKESKNFEDWSQFLKLMSQVVSQDEASKFLRDLSTPSDRFVDFFTSLFKDKLNEEKKNLIRVLAEKRRLTLLPTIAKLFENMKDKAEGNLVVEFVSADPLTAEEERKIKAELSEKLKEKIIFQSEVDPKLLGGYLFRYGDTVIDASIAGKIQSLKQTLGG